MLYISESKAFGSRWIGYRSDTVLSDWCLFDGDPWAFASRDADGPHPLLFYHTVEPCVIESIYWGILGPCDFMMTSSNGNIFRVTGHLCGEFTGLRWIPHTKASDAELWCFLWYAPNQTSKHSRGWWFEMLSHPLWRHRNVSSLIGWLKAKSVWK